MSLGSASNFFLGAASATGGDFVELLKSVRFNSADSAYLDRTPSSSGSNTTWTLSTWVKKTGNDCHIFGAGDGNIPGRFGLAFDSSDKINVLVVDNNNTVYLQNSDAVFRDSSAWYHIVVVADTTNSTAADRLIVYVNGVRQTLSGGAMPSSQNTFVNTTAAHTFGRRSYTASDFFNGYLADTYLIDGIAKDATDFGAYDDNGVWQAVSYSGSYPDNSFHLFDFANESGIGDDSSGNDNDFTVNNISPATVDYASGLTTSGGAASGYPASNVFDSNTNNLFITSGSSIGTTWTFTPPSSIPATSLVIKVSQGAKYRVNGGSYTTFSGGGSGELTLTSSITGGAITSIEGYSLGEYQIGLWYIKINGNFLFSDQGAGNDVLFDVPTNGTQSDTGVGGEVSGNYCLWNPLNTTTYTFSNGNLEATGYAPTNQMNSTIGVSSGKWYAEFTFSGSGGSTNAMIGISRGEEGYYPGQLSTSYGYIAGTGQLYNNAAPASYGATYTYGDVIGVALDLDGGTLTFYKNNSTQGQAATGLSGTYFFAARNASGGSDKLIANWGQRAFTYTAPSGYKALNTASMSSATIADGLDYFEARTYNGDTTSSQSGFKFSPDFLWLKSRSNTDTHFLFDIVRGATNYLSTSNTNAEGTQSGSVTSFDSDGFSYGSWGPINNSSMIAWCWDAGSSTTSNTDGDITSSVRANQTAGFSIVTWTGSGSSGDTVGHGLNAQPSLIVSKRRSDTGYWPVYHKNVTSGYAVKLNGTEAEFSGLQLYTSTAPTSSVFSVGSNSVINGNGDTYVAYCFAPVVGYSAFGSYDGNGSTNGRFIHTGFRPRWVMLKNITNAYSWYIYDTTRDTYNVMYNVLIPNTTNADTSDPDYSIDVVSNGFKCRTSNIRSNAVSNTYVYAAFAENPFQANGGLAR